MLNRFSTAVQGAVQGAVTNVSSSVMGMMGEDISKLYEMPKDSTASGGHELLWKIYPGICKKSGLEVSIFVFDKDEMKKQHKDVQERIIDIMRTDMKTLRVLRHPHVLKVEHVFEETKRSLAFVTEKIICSLANARKRFDHVGNVTPEVLEVGLVEFELACGFMHIGEALSFLHREGRRVHMTIGPQSVFITPTGNWKLAGLGFSRVVENQVKCRSEYYSGSVPESKKNVPLLYVDPPLEYCAPELVTEPREFNTHADMFSLGLLVYEMFKAPLSDGTRGCILESRDRNQMTHGYKVQSLHPISFPSSVPVGLHNTIRSLLAIVPEQRPEARAFLASPFFNAGPVKDLRSLQTLVELEPSEQAKYLDTLKDKIKDFSPRILRDMVLPGLQTVVMNKQLAPFVIPPLLEIVAVLDKSTFSRLIAPMMIPLLGIVEPVQCMLMFASGLHVILPKAEDAYIRDHVVPMLCRCLDSTVPEILDTVLQKIVDHADLFEYQTLKAVILPRVIKLIMQPPKLSVRVNALLWLGKSYHVFDKDLLANTVLPTLGKTLEVDKSPTVCMCVLACYDNLGKHLGSEFIATAILPAVTPLLWEKSLDGKNFDIVCQKVQAMLQQVMKDRDEMFMSQNAVKGATTALERKSGIRSAVKAKEDDEDDATVRVNAMLQDKVAEPSSTKKGAYQDEPFYTSDSNKDPEPSSSTYASKRREKKKNRNKSKPAPTATADILNLETTTNTTNMFDNLNMSSTAAPTSSSMFNGMTMGDTSMALVSSTGPGQYNAPPPNMSPGMNQNMGMSSMGMQPTGMQPTGMQSSGMQSSGMQSSGMQPAGMQLGYMQPGNMQSGNMQSGHMQSGHMQSGNMQSGNMQSGNMGIPHGGGYGMQGGMPSSSPSGLNAYGMPQGSQNNSMQHPSGQLSLPAPGQPSGRKDHDPFNAFNGL